MLFGLCWWTTLATMPICLNRPGFFCPAASVAWGVLVSLGFFAMLPGYGERTSGRETAAVGRRFSLITLPPLSPGRPRVRDGPGTGSRNRSELGGDVQPALLRGLPVQPAGPVGGAHQRPGHHPGEADLLGLGGQLHELLR